MKLFDWMFGPGKDGGSVYERRGILSLDAPDRQHMPREDAPIDGEIPYTSGSMGGDVAGPDRTHAFARLLGLGGD